MALRFTNELNDRPYPSMEQSPDDPPTEFNKLYEESESRRQLTIVSQRVLDGMLVAKMNGFNQDRLLMNLQDVTLTLCPVEGQRGWDTYKLLAGERDQYMQALGERVGYSVDIDIVYTPLEDLLCVPELKRALGGATHMGDEVQPSIEAHKGMRLAYFSMDS